MITFGSEEVEGVPGKKAKFIAMIWD